MFRPSFPGKNGNGPNGWCYTTSNYKTTEYWGFCKPACAGSVSNIEFRPYFLYQSNQSNTDNFIFRKENLHI
jgi:hypothetical protein